MGAGDRENISKEIGAYFQKRLSVELVHGNPVTMVKARQGVYSQ